MTDTTITLEVPGMEPVTTTLDGMRRATEYLKTPAGKSKAREIAAERGTRSPIRTMTAVVQSLEEQATEGATNLFTPAGIAADQLRSIVERIEKLEEEKAGIASDIKDVLAEAKANGFCTKTLRKIIALRKRDASERAEEEAILELYMQALNMA